VLVLLDPRLQRQRYGRVFMDSLPRYRVTQELADVEAFFAGPKVVEEATGQPG
jgi:ATP-dependent DNA helicase DinG